MKRSRKFKIFIIIAIVFIACFIATKVEATTTTVYSDTSGATMQSYLDGGNYIKLSYLTASQNKYIYCRDRSHMLPRSGEYIYEKDGSSYTYPNSSNQGAGWAYLLGKNQNLGSAAQISSSTLQNAFWQATGDSLTGYSNPTLANSSGNPLIYEANAYGNLIASGAKIDGSTFTKDKIEVPDTVNDLKEQGALYNNTYGPIKINCDYWTYNDQLKAGITELHVYAKDTNNNLIQPKFKIIYNYREEHDYNEDWYGAWSNTSSLTYTNRASKIVELNQKMKTGFYIYFDQKVTSFSLKLKYKYIKASVTITPIKSIQNIQTSYRGWYTCSEHENTTFSSDRGYKSGVVYTIANGRYTYSGKSTTNWQLKRNTMSTKDSNGNYLFYEVAQKGVYCKSCYRYGVTVKSKYEGGIIEGKCSYCGAILTSAGNPTNKYENCYKYTSYKYTPWRCNNTNICGTWQTFNNSELLQKLTIINPSYQEAELEMTTSNITVQRNAIKLKLEKYNVNDYGKTTQTQLEDSKFKVIAKQDGNTIYEKNGLKINEEITIPAEILSKNNVYVTIEETEAPKGYDKINKRINVIMTYKEESGKISYNPNFRPSREDWEKSGFNFDNTFGNWEWIEEGDSNSWHFPNTYKSKENDIYIDTIEIDKKTEYSPYIIKVYDKPTTAKFILKKFDGYFNVDYTELEGAEFTVKAMQKIGNTLTPLTIKTQSLSGVGEVNGINANDLVEVEPINVKPTDKMYITIIETKAPKGYNKLSKPIVMLRAYDGKEEWAPGFRVRENDDIAAFGSDYALWAWLLTEEDKYTANGQEKYNWNMPNAYCINNVMEDPLTQTNDEIRLSFVEWALKDQIKDFIYVDYDNKTGEYTINVYNEKLVEDLRINIEKYGEDFEQQEDGTEVNKIFTEDEVEFEISIMQDGNWIEQNKKLDNFGYTLKTESNSPVYAIIKETKAPEGYYKINYPIVVKYTYENKKWNPKVNLTQSELQSVGLEDLYGGWQLIDESTKQYQSSKNDLISLGEDNTIGIYDKQYEKFEKITLFKVNKNNIKIPGAVFKGRISNVVSFELHGTTYKPQSGDTFNFTDLQLTNGEISLNNVVLANANEDLKIVLEETAAPTNYWGFTGEIEASISYTNQTITISYEDEDTESDIPVNAQFIGDNIKTPTVEIKIQNNIRFAPKNIRILKVDDNNTLLDGAKFNGTILNILSFKKANGEKITVQNGSTYYFNDLEFENGEFILNDIELANDNDNLRINLTETEAPEGYKIIPDLMRFDISFKNKTVNYSYGSDETEYYAPIKVAQYSEDEYENKNIDIEIRNRPINEQTINLGGLVWLDGDTNLNNKTNTVANGKKEDQEDVLSSVFVYLYDSTNTLIKTTVTDEDGRYSFENIDYNENGYTVVFEYNGVTYKDTVYKTRVNSGEINSVAKENQESRNSFNNKFHTIEWNKAIEKGNNKQIDLFYQTGTENGVAFSKLDAVKMIKFNGNVYYGVADDFAMYSSTEPVNTSNNNLNFGLVPRGTDMALTTNEHSAEISINGKNTTQNFDLNGTGISLEEIRTPKVAYNLAIRKSDYNYRIRDYVNNKNVFSKENFTDNTTSSYQSGDELKVYVKYRVDLINQGPVTTKINQIKYNYDKVFTYNAEKTASTNEAGLNYTVNQQSNNTLLVNFNNGIEVLPNTTKTVYLVFELPKEVIEAGGQYFNAAEITSYSTEEGVVDIDSAPGNLSFNANTGYGWFEDDSCSSRGLKIAGQGEYRAISGYVWDDKNGNSLQDDGDANKVDDVIVQLIELKTFDTNKYYEYIWQETVSGSNQGLRMKLDGTGIESYEYDSENREKGRYEFKEFIPGNYIVRFIYGDNEYEDYQLDLGNVIKYNGQDYKSTVDINYSSNMYDASKYPSNASVARDNEARRLETMAYSVNVDKEKGLLLKLLDVISVDELNATEIITLASIGGKTVVDPTNLTAAEKTNLNNVIRDKQKEVLQNTWMCAETSKISVDVQGFNNINSMNFGLKERPKTGIEIKKYITGIKIVASNGQTLVNADLPINNYLSGKPVIQGINNGLKIIEGTKLQYEVGTPTELNTIIEGASIEFTYTVVVKNTSEKDYLSSGLIDSFNLNGNTNTIGDYTRNAKDGFRDASTNSDYIPGKFIGSYYYTEKVTNEKENLIGVTGIKDYVNNDLQYAAGTDGVQKVEAEDHYILNDDNSLSKIKINTVLQARNTTGKLKSNQNVSMYSVTLKPNSLISAGGVKEFANYIAEMMSYSVANGRRTTYTSSKSDGRAGITPGNAEIINQEYREGHEHEPDEADTLKVELGVETGQDKQVVYIWITIIAIISAIIGIGTFTIKKYALKK